MSESTSCSNRAAATLELIRLGLVRQSEELPESIIRALGEECPAEFFRHVVEPLSDSFDPDQAAAYDQIMTAWIPHNQQKSVRRVQPALPSAVRRIYVLSRVTLGADIKITSMILDAMKRRFAGARVVLVGNRKCAELFSGVEHQNADYPRTGPVSTRIAFAHALIKQLDLTDAIVVDPDSRITQLGLIPIGAPEHYFHFHSRIADSTSNLSGLASAWLQSVFAAQGEAYIAPEQVDPGFTTPYAAVSLGTGGNDTKRLSTSFEAKLVELLCNRYGAVWIDRGAGGEEALRVNKAVGQNPQVRFWEGSFAGFASLISRAAFYAGYDSAGQHAAAACGTPLVTVFAGAPSRTFQKRWAPEGKGPICVIDAHTTDEREILARLAVLRP